jgi:hypothetical protein
MRNSFELLPDSAAISRKNFGLGRSSREWRAGRQRRPSMQMTDAEYDGLLARLTKLEKQIRLSKIVGALILLAAVLSLTAKVTAQGDAVIRETKSPTVEAQTFLLKDSAGYMRGKMTVDGDRHPMLDFYDLSGKVIWSTDNHVIPTK